MVTVDSRDRTEHMWQFPPTRWLLIIGLVLVASVLVLGAHLQSVVGPVRPDTVGSGHLIASGRALHSAWQDIADVGSEVPVLIAVTALMAWAASKRDWPAMAVAIVGPSVALLLTEYVLKPLIDRTSPKGVYSYPSGHATVVAALVTVALLFVYRYLGTQIALLWTPYGIAVVLAVAAAVVALRWHYISDAVGGVALGIGVVCIVAGTSDLVASRTERVTHRT